MIGRGSRPTASPERASRLAEREVERGALERPAPVVEVDEALGRGLEERQRREVLRERVERPVAGERERRPALLQAVVLGAPRT